MTENDLYERAAELHAEKMGVCLSALTGLSVCGVRAVVDLVLAERLTTDGEALGQLVRVCLDLVRDLVAEVEKLRGEVRALESQEMGAAECCYAHERAIERVRAQADRWDQWNRVLIAGGAGGIASVPLSDVVHDIRRALDGEVDQ